MTDTERAQKALAGALCSRRHSWRPTDTARPCWLCQTDAAAILAYPFTPDQRRALAAHFLDADALAAAERMYLAIGAVTAGDRSLSEEYILAYVELGDALRALGAKP